MIIFQTPSSDTFVTNMDNAYNKGINANFGRASTIDLFKLYNENSNSKSKSIIKITGIPADDENFYFLDSDDRKLTFVFSSVGAQEDGIEKSEEGFIIIGTNGVDSTDLLCQRIYNTISALKNRREANIDLYYYKSNLALFQTIKGTTGDKEIKSNSASVLVSTGESFVRLDYSVGLIKFNIEEFLNAWALEGNQGAFDNLTAELRLKDTSTGLSKPKDYEISIYSLNKSFLEGIGKDIVNFSDVDYANFTNINTLETWSIPGLFFPEEDTESIEPIDSFYVKNGNEDVTFNVSSYVLDRIDSNLEDRKNEDFGFLITFSEPYLFDNKSYFVKRFGSRHLLNKTLVPTLEFKINDSDYIKIDKNRYVLEDSNKLIDFYFESKNIDPPLGFQNLNAKFEYLNLATNEYETLVSDLSGEGFITNFVDYKGISYDNIKKASLQFSIVNTPVMYENLSKKGLLATKITWFWEDVDLTQTLPVFSEIKTIDFSFTARKKDFKKEYLTINFDRELIGDNSEYQIELNILDPRANHDFVKTPYQLESIDLGDVCYRIYDTHSGKTLIDFDNVATRLVYNGKSYVGNVFIGETMKNKILNFDFKVINSKMTNHILKNLKSGFKVN